MSLPSCTAFNLAKLIHDVGIAVRVAGDGGIEHKDVVGLPREQRRSNESEINIASRRLLPEQFISEHNIQHLAAQHV